MTKRNDSDARGLLESYERMYGASNTPDQVADAIATVKETAHQKRPRTRGRHKRGSSNTEHIDRSINLEQATNGSQKFVANETNTKKIQGNDMKLKFDELYNRAINEQADMDLGALEMDAGEDVDATFDGGVEDEEGEEVTITLDRDLAQKLFELLKDVVDSDAGFEDETGGEEGEDDLDATFEEPEFDDMKEEGAGEDSLKTAPDGVAHNTKRKLAAGATQNIGSITHQKSSGAQAAQKPQTPKPLKHKTT